MAALVRKWLSYSKASGLIRRMIVEGSHDIAVLDKAAELTSELSPMNYAAEAQVLWAYVRNNIRYLDDPTGDDHFQGPAITMARGAGDCDDQVILLGSLLRSIGFETRIVFVFKDPPKNYDADFPAHVYLELNVNKGSEFPLWVCAETIPLPDDRGGFYYATFGAEIRTGFREYVEIN